ncbi:MAG TPA: lipid A deacylase LpxR family protein [Opitutaceae bacterium]|nr:lipid A deacylase LpxR family protein [Opitutaceae bacterium]
MSRFRSLLLSLTLCSCALRASDADVPVTRAEAAPIFTLYFENDFFGGTDRHYTNGVKFSWLTRDLVSWAPDGWRRNFVDALPFINRAGAQKDFGFAFGQNMYTPQDRDRFVPDPKDRPYAGWSYVEFSFLSKTESSLDTLSFQGGIVGPHSYAGDLQRAIHRWTGNSRPNGWEYQLKDEPGVNAVYEHKWRLYARAFSDVLGADLVPHLGASLGNVQTYANAGGTLRLGFNLPSDFGVQLIRPGGAGSTPIDDLDPRVSRRRKWSVFVFGAADGRAVARDIFLDGNTWQDGPHVDKEPFVADLSYGFGLIGGRWQFTFSQVERTKEFRTQQENCNKFGSVTLSCAF